MIFLVVIAASCAVTEKAAIESGPAVQLGSFSVSLSVKDLKVSQQFYAKLGFTQVGGDPAQNWLIVRNGVTTIGLFQGMFEGNLMTFNPGWDKEAQPLVKFQDVRDLQAVFEAAGITPITRADPKTDGPASFMLADPDGNVILVDQHVSRAK